MSKRTPSSRPARLRTVVQANLPAHLAVGLYAMLAAVKSRRLRFLTERHRLRDLQSWMDGVYRLHQTLAQVASVFQSCTVQVDAQLGELLALANALPRLRKSPVEIRRRGTHLIRELLGKMPVYRRQTAQVLAKAHRHDFWYQFVTTFASRQRSTSRTLLRKAPRKIKR